MLLRYVQEEYTRYRDEVSSKERGVGWRRARGALKALALTGAAAAVGVRVGATRPSLGGK